MWQSLGVSEFRVILITAKAVSKFGETKSVGTVSNYQSGWLITGVW